MSRTKTEIEKAKMRERIEVLKLRKHVIESRIRATQIPEVMDARCRELEKLAEELFDQAQRMRESLTTDTENMEALNADLCVVNVMLEVNEFCLRHNITAETDMEKITRNVMQRMLRDGSLGNDSGE